MKLPQLLSHFLYINKELSLPGIGVFTLDPSIVIPELQDKEQPQIVQGVSFEKVAIRTAEPALIEFLHKYTGKMKTLAESDLDSYLRLGIQLLHIGKPFYFDGIGSITKSKDEQYEFIPGEYSTVKLVSPDEEKTEASDKRKKILDEPEKEYSPQSQTAKRLLLTLAVIGGIAIIAWAGYNLYKKKTAPTNNGPNSEVALKEDTETVQKIDTSKNINVQPDSIATKKDNIVLAPKPTDSSFYKFVILTTTNKHRAFRRYNQLDSIEHKVKISTKDSSLFKIYFVIHTSPKDTLRIKDSLNGFYATKTTIEQ